MWLGFEAVHRAGARAQAGAGAAPGAERVALAADHLLYGLVLSRAARRAAGADGRASAAPPAASACASGSRNRAGRRLPARSSTAWRASSGSAGFVLNDERGVRDRGRGRRRGGRGASSRACRPRRRRWPRSSAVGSETVAAARRARLRDRRRARAAARPARSSRPTPRPATTAWPSCSTRPTAATATRSSTAPTAARASRSSAASPTTGRCTTMAGFAMCAACRGRVRRPAPTAASTPSRTPARPAARGCGWLDAGGGDREAGRPARARRRRRCGPGAIVAVKGLGGYHLACRARRRARRSRALRARKHREDKPFALMAPDLEAARRAGASSAPTEEALLRVAASGRSCSRRARPGARGRRGGRAAARATSA